MTHRALADLVLLLHCGFIIFVVAGGLLALRWRWAPLLHLPAVVWGVIVEACGTVCPLTPIENALREAAGSSGYSGGFIDHYLFPVVYPEFLSQPVQFALAGLVVGVNVLVYAAVSRRRRAAGSR